MAQIIIKDVDEAMMAKLADLANANRRSVETQILDILTSTLDAHAKRQGRLDTARRIAGMTPAGVTPTDSVLLLREDRSR